jgi:hypothetical protein
MTKKPGIGSGGKMDLTKQGVKNLDSIKRPKPIPELCPGHFPGKKFLGRGYPNAAFSNCDDWQDDGWPTWITPCRRCGKELDHEYIF